jgi:hypothetical protein
VHDDQLPPKDLRSTNKGPSGSVILPKRRTLSDPSATKHQERNTKATQQYGSNEQAVAVARQNQKNEAEDREGLADVADQTAGAKHAHSCWSVVLFQPQDGRRSVRPLAGCHEGSEAAFRRG